MRLDELNILLATRAAEAAVQAEEARKEYAAAPSPENADRYIRAVLKAARLKGLAGLEAAHG